MHQAAVAFRRWAYLSPDDPTAHFQLAAALDAVGAHASALRAYRAALGALDRSTPERLVEQLHGYNPAELRRLLIDRCLAASDRLDPPAPTTALSHRHAPTVGS